MVKYVIFRQQGLCVQKASPYYINKILFSKEHYETLSYATQSENKLPNIQKAYIIDMSSIK